MKFKLEKTIYDFAETYQLNLKIGVAEKSMKPILFFNDVKLSNVEETELFGSILTCIMLKDREMDQILLNKFKERFL